MSTSHYYDENARAFFDCTVNLDMGEIYAPFLKFLKRGDRILDAGCGSGRDSLYFLQKGFDVFAFDGSAEMTKLASAYLGRPVWKMDFSDIGFVEDFDAVWACASLLHVPQNEIEDVVERLLRALKTGGIFYASFKKGEGEEQRGERLFSLYEKDGLETLMGKFPCFKILDIRYTIDVRPEKKDEGWWNLTGRKISRNPE